MRPPSSSPSRTTTKTSPTPTDYLGAFDYTSGSGKHTRQHTWSVTVTNADVVRLTEHEAHTWVSASTDHPVSVEVETMLAEHFEVNRLCQQRERSGW